MHGNFILGRTFAEDEGWDAPGRRSSSFLIIQEFAPGAKLQWDIVPLLQVGLFTRQHVLASVGTRIPLNDRGGDCPTQFIFYPIWDRYDGNLLEAW